VGCAAIWGSTFLVISIGNDTVPPLWAAALRLALAAAILTLMARARGQRLPEGAALRAAAQYGLFGFGISLSLLYWAEKKVPSGLAAVFYATIPLTSTLLTRAFGLEKITLGKVAAAAVALGGVAVIFSDQLGGEVSAWPLVALLAAATSAGFGSVLLKRGPRQPPVGVNAVAAAVGCVFCLAASLLAREPHALPRTFAQVFPIVYLTLAGSVGAFVLFAWLVNHWDVTRISFVSVIVPVIAMALGVLVRHERLSLASFIGSALVLAGVLLRIRSDRAPAAARRPATGPG
jgi:drug/metabolite transporter (DMT)-like permease